MSSPRRPSRGSLVIVIAFLATSTLGCASGAASRDEVDALRAEVRAVRRDNEALSRRVEALGSEMEAIVAREKDERKAAGSSTGKEPVAESTVPAIPPDLAVVKVAPSSAMPHRRRAPPVPTAIPIAEPDPDRLQGLDPQGERSLPAEAESELRLARAEESLIDRAHALERFVSRYPRHPSADNALVEASEAYAQAGKAEAACDLARRVMRDYPAGDAMSDALERMSWCESRRGATEHERELLLRIVAEYPKTAAAKRAGQKLASLSGAASPNEDTTSTRSSP